MTIGSLPTVEIVQLGIFHGNLTGLFATRISHHGTDTTVVVIQGNAIRFHLFPLTAPVPHHLLLHTEANIGYPHVGPQSLVTVRPDVTMVWTDFRIKGCVMMAGNAPVMIITALPQWKLTITRGMTTATIVLCVTHRVATAHGILMIGTTQLALKEDAILIVILTVRRVTTLQLLVLTMTVKSIVLFLPVSQYPITPPNVLPHLRRQVMYILSIHRHRHLLPRLPSPPPSDPKMKPYLLMQPSLSRFP
jgi:hypothetical protein